MYVYIFINTHTHTLTDVSDTLRPEDNFFKPLLLLSPKFISLMSAKQPSDVWVFEEFWPDQVSFFFSKCRHYKLTD